MEKSFFKNLFSKKKTTQDNTKGSKREKIDIKKMAEEQKRLREEESKKALEDFNQWRRP